MGAAMIPLAIAAAVASTASAVAQGYAASAADKANAKIAENNAQIATQNAQFAAEEGEANAGAQSEKNRVTMGSIKANQGASGVDVNTGSNANVQASQAEIGQLDTMNIRSNAARQAYGFQTEATSYEGQAAADKAAGKNAVTMGYINGAASAVKSAAAIAGAAGGGDSGGVTGGVTSSQNAVSFESAQSAFGGSDPWTSYQNNNSLGVTDTLH